MKKFINTPFGGALPIVGYLMIFFLYAYARIYLYPMDGFAFDSTSGVVTDVDPSSNPPYAIQVGDHILQINQVMWQAYAADRRVALAPDVSPGNVLDLKLQRGNQVVSTAWIVPPVSDEEKIISYAEAVAPISYWVIGTLTLLFIRPKDIRWFLLISFIYLIGFLTMAGTLAIYRVGYSAIFLRMSVWLALPIILHLHMIFPRGFKRNYNRIKIALYGIGLVMAAAEGLQLVPKNLWFIGGLLTIALGIAALVAQTIRTPRDRTDLNLMLVAVGLAVLPLSVVYSLGFFGTPDPWWSSLVYLPLVIIPLAYFYAIYRHQLGGLVTRSNRYATLIVFFSVIFYLDALVVIIAANLVPSMAEMALISVFLILIASIATHALFPTFQEFFERWIMGISIRPSRLLEMYSSSITTSSDRAGLASILVDKILPSLLVRQSALVYVERGGLTSFLFVSGLSPDDGPFTQEFPLGQLENIVNQRQPDLDKTRPVSLKWINLALPLHADNRLNGYWLLGRRDPDDSYMPGEVPTLQAIADQTAIALINIIQAERLRSMYAVDIERRELERLHLASELHDEVLSQMAVLSMKSDLFRESDEASQAYNQAVKHIREAINGLRPAMLYYGLGPALANLAEEMDDLAPDDVDLHVDIVDHKNRFDTKVELYLFRIVQQACNNALQHAQPSSIWITGEISENGVDLEVKDDGIGFPSGEQFDLANLLVNKHFGLAGMSERAELIGARLEIISAPGQGSTVHLIWSAGSEISPDYHPGEANLQKKSIFFHPLA